MVINIIITDYPEPLGPLIIFSYYYRYNLYYLCLYLYLYYKFKNIN